MSTYWLQCVGDLVHDGQYSLLEVFIRWIELHLIILIDKLHLEKRQTLVITFIKQLNKHLYTPNQQIFYLKKNIPWFIKPLS